MQVVWDRDEVTVREVYEAFRERRPVAYTTVLTTMRILEQKGHLGSAARRGRTSIERGPPARACSARWFATSSTACSAARRSRSCSISSATSDSAQTTSARSRVG